MAKYKNYVVAQSLEEAYELNRKKSAVIVGGNMWLRMCGMTKQTAIDLSALGLGGIREDEHGFLIGAMTTLRELETSSALAESFGGVFAKAFEPIVGTQFRNTATVGGSIYSRFGFSDVSALFLALDAEVVTFARGRVPLTVFQKEAWDRDILTHIYIKKGQHAAITGVRRAATDIPTLVCAASLHAGGLRIVLGARPSRAVIVCDGFSPFAGMVDFERLAQEVPMGSNARASETYRRKVAPVLMARAAEACRAQEG